MAESLPMMDDMDCASCKTGRLFVGPHGGPVCQDCGWEPEDVDDEPCPRCIKPVPAGEGGADSPLCDACWEEENDYGRGLWAGLMGWALEDEAADDPARFRRGHAAGLKRRQDRDSASMLSRDRRP